MYICREQIQIPKEMIKRIKLLAIVAASLVILISCAEDNKVMLFNGQDLDNWDTFLFDTVAAADEVFRAEDGIIKVSGIPNGYIVTKDSYENYKLHVEWRWAAEPENSGVLVHVQESNLVEWPQCIESQLKHPNAGDIVLIGHGSGVTVRDTAYLINPDERRYKVIPKFEESSENTPGEWNMYDITCNGDNIKIKVNGTLQNDAVSASFKSGQIALQSEGGPIEFRNVYLVPLEK